jgi:hypothetical protein
MFWISDVDLKISELQDNDPEHHAECRLEGIQNKSRILIPLSF